MTAPADPQLLLDQAVSRLTGPGGPFEIVEEEVLGTVMPVMKNRGHAIGELISASRAWGDGDYLVTSDRRISFTEHADSVAALATALRDKYGVRKGDRVGILAANTPEWVMTFFATQALGAIAVGLNGWWVPREVTHGIELSRPKVLVVDAKRGAALPELPADITVLTMEEDLPALIAEYAGSDVPST
ncbi:MAG: acyl--CoA ligase, partial [Rhodococcus sp. (in: high G+C Gram-positive bacteria)]|nr:acyl--CoA ligase [Rhodococcus sp. (in: high G+C Gram-positive bacteria)]